MARYYWFSLPALPPRKSEALFEGRSLLHRKVRIRAPRLSARTAWPGPHQVLGVRSAASRKAEDQENLRPARKAVPQPLRKGRTHEGRHWLESARRCSSAVWTTWLTARVSLIRAPKLVSSFATAISRSTDSSVNIPSYLVDKGDVVEVREKSRSMARIGGALEAVKRREIPQWLELDSPRMKARIRDLPARDDVTAPMEERLVVELYSK